MITSRIPGVMIRQLDPRSDERGYFLEVYRRSDFSQVFVQSNRSHSRRGVLRGLHYHRQQDDLWHFVSGRAQVALVDLRRKEQLVVEHFVVEEEEPVSILIPRGVAHGFLALSDVDLMYWVTREFDDSDEFGIAWNDPALAIPWLDTVPTLSARDAGNEELQWDQIPQF